MTVEQKAKAYDKALEKAKIWQEHLYDVNDKDYADELNYIFPELSESEDEKIRKDILCYFEHYVHDIKGADLQKWIAWLEKQGEQESIDPDTVIQQRVDALADIVAEQNSTDELEPKFKEGEWITNGDYTWKIVEVKPLDYILQSQDGNIVDDTISHVNEHFHSFTIQDAKEGDVLLFEGFYNSIVLFQGIGINGKGRINYHCKCDLMNYSFGVQGDFACLGTIEKDAEHYHPATKEQRDLLFQKMKEAGYIFDFEKKELKKLSQSEVTKTSDQEEIAEIPFGAKDSELQEATFYIPKGFHAEIDNDKVIIKKGEKPAEWSENDERIKKRLINLVNEIYNNINYITFLEHKELLAWLEKLDDNVEL